MIYVQYQNSSNIVAYVQALKDNIRVSATEFNNSYFNILTCGTEGLDNWGRILNRSRTVLIPKTLIKGKIGFDTGTSPPTTGDYPQNFNHGNFTFAGATTNMILDNEAYRALLRFIYLNYVTNATLKTINKNINFYYNPDNDNGRQVAVTNTAPMEITYAFNFPLQQYEKILFNQNFSVLPTPIGVKQILVYPG